MQISATEPEVLEQTPRFTDGEAVVASDAEDSGGAVRFEDFPIRNCWIVGRLAVLLKPAPELTVPSTVNDPLVPPETFNQHVFVESECTMGVVVAVSHFASALSKSGDLFQITIQCACARFGRTSGPTRLR